MVSRDQSFDILVDNIIIGNVNGYASGRGVTVGKGFGLFAMEAGFVFSSVRVQ